jgi:hypothetical protein
MPTNTHIELEEIRKRAAAIRGNWSNVERLRRHGLPPDVPSKLRDFILAPRVAAWTTRARA